MVDVKVSKLNNDLNERETKLIEVLLLNLDAQANAQVTKANMMFNPLEKKEGEDIFHFQFAWQSSITSEKCVELKEAIEKRFEPSLKMGGLVELNITLTENSYLIKNT
jgi:hypothetical protein